MQNVSQKSRAVMLLLALFLGFFGVHRFYAEKVGTGVLMCILSITLIFSIVSIIWTLIDFIVIASGTFKDGDNLKIVNW